MVIIISAIGSNHVIGDGDQLPWHIPSEYRQFLGYVKDQTVLMGRRSFVQFKEDMLPRRSVVVSRTLKTDRAEVFDTFQEALAYAKRFPEDIFIGGGQSIYEEAIPVADCMYLSHIKGEYRGNVFFPAFDKADWIIEKEEEFDEFVFIIYRRKAKESSISRE